MDILRITLLTSLDPGSSECENAFQTWNIDLYGLGPGSPSFCREKQVFETLLLVKDVPKWIFLFSQSWGNFFFWVRGLEVFLQTDNQTNFMNSGASCCNENKQWLHFRIWQFLIAYMVHSWPSWFIILVIANSPFFSFFLFWCIILLLII